MILIDIKTLIFMNRAHVTVICSINYFESKLFRDETKMNDDAAELLAIIIAHAIYAMQQWKMMIIVNHRDLIWTSCLGRIAKH